jgi:outer membrane lipoprotein SlyB
LYIKEKTMSTTPAPQGLHPMLWVAAASVTAVSLAGIAKLTGLLPGDGPAHSTTEAVVSAPADGPAPALVAPPAKVAAAEPEAAPAAPKHKEVTHAAKPPQAKAHSKPQAHPAVASTNPPPADAIPAPPPAVANGSRRVADVPPPVCHDCGVIESVEAIQQKGEGSGLGAVGGAILGGVLGHQVGEGSGKQLARIGGAVLGGFAGNEVERRARTVSHYQVTVRMDDGTRRVITEQNAPEWHSGDQVRVRNGEIVGGGAGQRSTQGSSGF